MIPDGQDVRQLKYYLKRDQLRPRKISPCEDLNYFRGKLFNSKIANQVKCGERGVRTISITVLERCCNTKLSGSGVCCWPGRDR